MSEFGSSCNSSDNCDVEICLYLYALVYSGRNICLKDIWSLFHYCPPRHNRLNIKYMLLVFMLIFLNLIPLILSSTYHFINVRHQSPLLTCIFVPYFGKAPIILDEILASSHNIAFAIKKI